MEMQSKTIIFLGSSVTYGSASGGYSMCEYIAEKLKCNAIKWAVSGTTLADINEESYVNRLKKNIKNQEKCDMFVCQLSTNDSYKEIPMGKIDENKNEFDVGTISGAIEFIVSTVRNKWKCPIAFFTGTYFGNERYAEMRETLIKISKKWDIDIIDLWNDKEMRNISKQDYEMYMKDPVHPTKIGYEQWWGPKFLEYLSKKI